jgi:predicted MFS family arabinose efflux permease
MCARFAITPGLAVAITFAAFGSGVGAWAGAAPAIIAGAGLDKERWALGIVAFTGAGVIVMYAMSRLAAAISGGAMLLAGIPLQALAAALLLTAQSPLVFFPAIALLGAANGHVDVFMNAEAAAIEHQRGRPLMAAFHAMFSLGMAAMALPASLIVASYGTWAAACVTTPLYALAWLAVAIAVPARLSRPVTHDRPRSRPVFVLALLGLIAGISMAGETVAMAWSAKFLNDRAPSLGAIAGACFYGLCHATMRFLGDAIRRRIGDPMLLAASLAVAALAFAVVALSGSFALSLAGFALVGVGIALIVPSVFALAAALEPHDRAGAIGFAALVTGLPRVVLPWAFGVVAERASLDAAFGLAAMMMLGGLVPAALLPRRGRRPA